MKKEDVTRFEAYLAQEEKATATIKKYLRDVVEFYRFMGDRTLTKELVLAYKEHLTKEYAPTSVNAALCSLNRFFAFLGRAELTVKSLKLQRSLFVGGERELTKQEYERLLAAAKAAGNQRLYLLMQTVCGTGIRVSELKYITVEALGTGRAEINCKGKRRRVLLPHELCKILKAYAKKQRIVSGAVFVTKSGKPLDRSNIWSDMKKLCKAAKVSQSKVFPHNLRHLFARTYYSLYQDIVRLADLLGHTSINTTRIYTVESGDVHRRQVERMGLFLRC
ncbi:MAG: tyrosine-type recombinase/integrase [Clostridia bacterium]|nr:tyrosine-type recombinase/integrase [Clostridia bacterium]